jgi:g-D-glutamyl-meso-diaminopimelate peptidase
MTFAKLQSMINELVTLDGVETRVIGQSVSGRPISAFHVGGNGKQIIVTGAIHAREWITAALVVELCKHFKSTPHIAGCGGSPPAGFWFIPLCNPDGAEISLDGGKPLWKANTRGVDLNVNFDADWGGGAQNVRTAGAENYIGEKPESEPEVIALVNFTKKIRPAAVIAYHSKGEVIYYSGCGKCKKRDIKIVRKIAAATGYEPMTSENSTGGYCDWVRKEFNIPAFTVEVGNDNLPHPIGTEHLDEIFLQNRDVPAILAD